MDKKTFFLVVLGVMVIVGYLGWSEYKKSLTEEQLFRQRLQKEEQQHQKEIIEAQRKLEEEKRMAEEQRKREKQELLSAENQAIMEKVKQKRTDIFAQIKGLIESKGNGTIEKSEADQIWARKISESAFFYADSLCTYSYHTGNEGEISVEIQFNIAQIGAVKPTTEKNIKTNYDFVEITALYEQKIFNYCEKEIHKANCDKNKDINTFKIFLNNSKAQKNLITNLELLKKLYQSDWETLKKMYKAQQI
jgi:hypothetical protein